MSQKAGWSLLKSELSRQIQASTDALASYRWKPGDDPLAYTIRSVQLQEYIAACRLLLNAPGIMITMYEEEAERGTDTE